MVAGAIVVVRSQASDEPSSAPSTSDIEMITIITTHAIAPSLATAYGKNGLPLAFRIA